MKQNALNTNNDLSVLKVRACADLSGRELARLSPVAAEQPEREEVHTAMRRYFTHLDGSTVTDLYAMVLTEVEAQILASVLEYTQGNQTRAAEILGLNRGTLRKKLKQHDLI